MSTEIILKPADTNASKFTVFTGVSVSNNSFDLNIRDDIATSIRAMFGRWANRGDIADDWLDNLRQDWEGRFTKLYDRDTD